MAYKTEFPTYDDVLPDLSPLADRSWHNNACPSFSWEDANDRDLGNCHIELWCEFKEHARRESAFVTGGKRFLLVISTHDMVFLASPVTAETLDELREACNVWYMEHVGYRPDSERADIPIGQLVLEIGQMAYLHSQTGDQS